MALQKMHYKPEQEFLVLREFGRELFLLAFLLKHTHRFKGSREEDWGFKSWYMMSTKFQYILQVVLQKHL